MMTCESLDIAAVVRRAALRKLGLFGMFPDLDLDDLVQHALHAWLRAGVEADPAKGAPSTIAYVIASRSIIDLWRQRCRGLRHERAAARSGIVNDPIPGDRDLLAWVRDQYSLAKGKYGHRMYRVGRRFVRIAQAGVIVLLSRRLGLDAAGVREFLRGRPDILHALHLRRLPSPGWFHAVGVLMRRAEKKSEGEGLAIPQ